MRKLEDILPKAIIVDLGGTLAHRGDRPKESYMERFHEDSIDETIAGIVRLEHASGTAVVILTGQREKSRHITTKWLQAHGVPFDAMYMKGNRDPTDSVAFKRDLYERSIKWSFDVKYVLEDREETVEMWRSIGVRCLQVASGQDREHYRQKNMKEAAAKNSSKPYDTANRGISDTYQQTQ